DPVRPPPADPFRLHHLGVRHPRLLPAAPDPRRPGHPDARPGVHPRGGRGAAAQAGPRRAAPGPVRALVRQHPAGRPRRFDRLRRDGDRGDRDRPAEDAQSGRPLLPDRDRHRRPGRRRGGAEAQHDRRLRGQRRRLRRGQHAELLVRHHPDPRLRRLARLAAGNRLRRVDRRRVRRVAAAADPAQPGHRCRLRRHPDALRPGWAARGPRQRLRADRPRQGRPRAHRHRPPRAAERPDPGGHDRRHPVGPPAQRRRRGRDGLLDPGHRPHPRRCHLRPRLPDGAGGDPPGGGHLRPRQPRRRHRLHVPRPEDPLWL
ncbi:MAG: ABC transporter, permease protein 1 (cluster 5, nickel/peptides/opines), partial [uncultured Thermomicrobiales bacterium]